MGQCPNHTWHKWLILPCKRTCYCKITNNLQVFYSKNWTMCLSVVTEMSENKNPRICNKTGKKSITYVINPRFFEVYTVFIGKLAEQNWQSIFQLQLYFKVSSLNIKHDLVFSNKFFIIKVSILFWFHNYIVKGL